MYVFDSERRPKKKKKKKKKLTEIVTLNFNTILFNIF